MIAVPNVIFCAGFQLFLPSGTNLLFISFSLSSSDIFENLSGCIDVFNLVLEPRRLLIKSHIFLRQAEKCLRFNVS